MTTIIIGGGISGLACAHHLHKMGHPFRLITDRIGGRMFHRADGAINFGATYMNEDYNHVGKFVARGLPFKLREAFCEKDGKLTSLYNWKNLLHFRSITRLLLVLRQYRKALKAFRRDSVNIPQKDLLPRYPLLERYAKQPAPELIAELGLQTLHEQYFKHAFRSTCFVEAEKVNSLFYLGTLLPVIVKTWVADFRGTYEKLTEGFKDKLDMTKVNRLTRNGSRWEVGTEDGREYKPDSVVIAAPYHNASKLYPVPKPYLPASGTVVVVGGEKHAKYSGDHCRMLFPENEGVYLSWRQKNDEDILFCTRTDPDLKPIYSAPKVAETVKWKTAIVVSNGDWIPQKLEDGLYLAGDYNLCGMEDSYISGLCTAKQVIRESAAVVRSF